MNLNEDTIMNDDASMIITPPPNNMTSSQRRFGRYREHMTQQPRSVSLRDFGCLDKDDAPVTPPSAVKSHHPLISSNPPEVPRHERPINRRLLLQEAQERLSLPDLFAPRTPTSAGGRRRVRPLAQRPSLMPIQPRLGKWDDSGCYEMDEVPSHSMSQRSFFCNMNPAEF